MSTAADNRIYREAPYPTGLHDIEPRLYHRDPCPTPSLSASIAKLLLACPRKAWHAHPRLNPDWTAGESTPERDFGAAVHSMVLGKGADVVAVSAKDWRTGAAKAAREEAREAGRVAILADRYADAVRMVRALREQLVSHELGWVFERGHAEQMLTWCEDGVWCRSLLDYWRPDLNLIVDYKTTGGSADPDTWARALYQMAGDIQAPFYLRGMRAAGIARDPRFVFVVQETDPPYAACVMGLDPAALGMAGRKVEQAIDDWRECLLTGVWPGFPATICWLAAPVYEERKLLAREERAQVIRQHHSKSLLQVAMDWQRP